MSTPRAYPPFSGMLYGPSSSGPTPAPSNASYLVLGLDPTLTDERVFSPTARFAATDGGAGAAYTLDLATAGAAGVYAYPTSVTTDAYGRVTAITAGSAPVASGWTNGGTTVYLSASTDVVSIGSNTGATNRKVTVTNTGTDNGIGVVTSASGNNVIATGVSGEANGRWAVDGGGNTRWGPGGATALDVRLYRTATNSLTLDNNAGGSASLSIFGETKTQTRILNVTSQAAGYVATTTDDVILADPSGGSFDVTIPNATLKIGRRLHIKRINTSVNTITVKSAGGNIDTVAAGTGIVLAGGSLSAITVVSDGLNWWII